MKNYSIVLETPRIAIPESNILEFVKYLISDNKLKIDYFGFEIDNPADYSDETMQRKESQTTYVNINFDEENEIDIENMSQTAKFAFILDLLTTNSNISIERDLKDVTLSA